MHNEPMTETPLTFGTAGLRGPMRDGPGGMNVNTVTRATWAVAKVLKDKSQGGSSVVVGRDARHNSDDFAMAAAEVFAAEGFSVILLSDPAPTPVVAYTAHSLTAAAGVQITASHNPSADNGYKVFFDGMQITSPTDRDIESAMSRAPEDIARTAVEPAGTDLIQKYIRRTARLRRTKGPVRVALTPMHGVGGEVALATLREAGIDDVHVVAEQFSPDPDFPTVAFPNPEEPGATDLLLALAADVEADIAIALDPDADRCAVGIPTPSGWRMLSGDETGWLLGDYLLSQADPDVTAASIVATTVVSSRMLAAIAASHGAHYVETLTGFKWLVRADASLPGNTLLYAYEEAIGHCVDPAAVRDKDGISAGLLACDLVVALRQDGRTVLDALDRLARQHGVHQTVSVSVSTDAHPVMKGLRAKPLSHLGGETVEVTDLLERSGLQCTDALIYTGESVRLAIRPSGTEPKIKGYVEVRLPPADDLADAKARAAQLIDRVRAEAVELLQRGPN
jgi:phosphomannomutase